MSDELSTMADAELREELLSRVEKIRDVLTRTAAESEDARFLVPEAVAALRDNGLLRMKAAREVGGLDATPTTQMLVIAALSEIDAAAGWNAMVNNNSTGFMSAFLPDEAVAEVFAGDEPPVAAGVAPPMGRARRTDGGYLLTGRWKTCSGVRQSTWLRLTGALEDEPDAFVFCVLPQADVQIHDTWHVLGLRGTGSYDVSVTGYFVPARRALTQEVRYRGGPQYRLRGLGASSYEHTGIALGIGRRAVKELAAYAARKGSPREALLVDLGRTDVAVRAAQAVAVSTYESIYRLLLDDSADVTNAGQPGQAVAAYATRVALDAVETMYRYTGTSGLYLPNPFEKLLRDVQAALAHVAVGENHFRDLGAALVAQV